MHKPEVKAGLALDIVFENELHRSNAHHLKAVVYECDKNAVIISQTSPPLSAYFTGRKMLMTFLVNRDNRVLRFGFPAKLVNHVHDYEISSGNTVEALNCRKTGEPEPMDFRMYFRVKPPSDTDVSLFIEEEKVTLLDISLGGAKFAYPKRYLFRARDKMQFRLVIGDEIFHVDAMIRSVHQANESAANKSMQFVSVEFEHRDRSMESSLGRAIMNIERSLLSEGKI